MLTGMTVCVYREVFPSSRCLFMYRDVVKVVKSVHRVCMVAPSFRLASLLGHISGNLTKMMVDFMGYDGSDYRVRIDNDLTFCALIYAVSTASYLDMRRRGLDVSALRYEDLVARPNDMCRVVLEFCHLPVSLAEHPVKAFDVDSQKNSLIAKSAIGHFKQPQMTLQTVLKLNEVLKKFGLPLIGEPGIIQGTLSCC